MKFGEGLILGIVCTAVGYAIGVTVVKKNSEAQFEHDVEEIREHYRQKLEENVEAVENLYTQAQVEAMLESQIAMDMAVTKYRGEGPDEPSEVSAAAAPAQALTLVQDDPPDEQTSYWTPPKPAKVVVQKTKDEDELRGIRVISEEDFYAAAEEFEQITLTYYSENDVLANMSEEAVDDDTRIKAIGAKPVSEIFDASVDPTVVYIRNDHLKKDFEVIWNGGSFSA